MTVRSHVYDYEQSSESGRERHVRIPYARLEDVTPTVGDPACVLCLVDGMEICGTVITINATTSEAIVNFAEGAVYRHNVRNVLTYNNDGPPQTEAGWWAINIGDPVYYDDNQDDLNGIKLSTAPAHFDGTPNPRFGTIIMLQDEDAGDFEKGDDQAGLSDLYAVLACGLNES